MALNEKALRALKPREKPFKVSDERSLYLLVSPSGTLCWRLKYRIAGTEKVLALGTYPDVSLKEARDRRDEARKLVAAGGDPAVKRKAEKIARADTFSAIAKEWLDLQRKKFSPATITKAEWTFDELLNPYIGSRPIREITPPELLAALRKLEARGKHETAHRTKQRAGQVFRYAIATGRADRDPSADLKGALAPVVVRHHPTITDPKGIRDLLRAIYAYRGQPATEAALKLAPLVFVRPGELRKAEWTELDLDGGEWRIPAHKMKLPEQHIVPLARQAVAILRELKITKGSGRYVFSCLRGEDRPMSENALTAALHRMGYTGDQMTWHGFRSLASTQLNEQGFESDWIEAQLAHSARDDVRAAYNYAKYLPQRRKMMQAWADYLDELRGAV